MIPPTITSATYNASLGVLQIDGENFDGLRAFDIDITKFRFDTATSGMYLTDSMVMLDTFQNRITINLNESDKDSLIDTGIVTENGTGTYNLVADEGWLTSDVTNTDTTNPITVVDYADAPNSAPQGSVTITGTPEVGEELTASNTLTDADGIGTIGYSWKRDGVTISGAFSSTYTLVEEDAGSVISVTANYTDGGGTVERVSSSATSPVVEPLDPSFTVTYAESINDGDVVPVGDGVTVTGTDLVPGEEYTFRVMIKTDSSSSYFPTPVDTESGKEPTFTLTSENPTFTEGEYSFGELPDTIQTRGYSFYLQRVDGTDPTTGQYIPHEEQFTGVGLDESTAVTFTLLNDEIIASAGGSSYTHPDPVVEPETVEPEPEVEVPDVVIPDEIVENLSPDWNLPSDKTNLKGGDVDDFDLFNEEDIVTGSGKMKGSSEDDFLRAFNGDDKLFGRSGDDFLRAGAGDDQLRGGRGDDVLFGGKGDDIFRDGKGDDYMILGGGDDIVRLGSGDNFIADFNESRDTLIAKGGIEWDGNVGSYDNGTVTLI